MARSIFAIVARVVALSALLAVALLWSDEAFAQAGSFTVPGTYNQPTTISPAQIQAANPGVTVIGVILPSGTTSGGGTDTLLTTNAGDAIVYTPKTNFFGNDTFQYQIITTAATGPSAPGTITVTIVPPAPTAGPVRISVQENLATSINVSAADSGVITSDTVVTTPAHGTAVAGAVGTITYTPAINYAGPDSFTYEAVGPGGTSAPATVTITVIQQIPVAQNQSATTAEGQTVTIAPEAGATGFPFTGIAVVTPPRHGTTNLANPFIGYTPNPGFSGTDSFTFTISNTAGTSTPATATIQVTPLPGPQALAISTTANTPVTIDPTQGATGGPFTAVAIATAPPAAAGTATVAGLRILFTPNPVFAGTAVFTYTLSNAFGTSAPAQISVTVAARPDPSLDPDVIGLVNAQLDAARRFYQSQIRNFENRLEALRNGQHGLSVGVGAAVPGQQPPSNAAPGQSSNASPDAPRGGGASADSGPADSGIELPDRLGIFVNGMVNLGDRNGTARANGFGFSTDGLSLGVDYRFSDAFVLGIGGGYASDSDTIGTDGTASNAEAYNVTLYGTYDPTDQIYIDGILTYGSLAYDSRRFTGTAGDFALGHRNGNQLYGAVTGGYELHDGSLSMAPYARLEVSSSQLDRFTETGGGIAGLIFNQQTLDTTTGILGFRADYAWSLEDAILSPHVRFEYEHEFAGANRTSILFADQPSGTAFGLQPDPVVRNYFTLGVGANYLMENGLSVFVDYEALLGFTNEASHTITFGVSKRF